MDLVYKGLDGLTNKEIDSAIMDSLKDLRLKRVLIIPPDITRFHSKAGYITNRLYHLLKADVHIDILPALGTHVEMDGEEYDLMFGDIPHDKFLYHDWRNDVVKVGEVDKNYISEITDGLWNEKVDIEVNKLILEGNYDLVISIGQVVPHEVIGMANYSKNILVGCGGRNTINQSHMIGAVFGMEKVMGKDHSPVRKVLDYGMKQFLGHIPITFMLTVTTAIEDDVTTHGLFIGDTRKTFERAVALAQEKNIDFLDKPIKKCIVYLDPKEFKSTWLGNKAIYRTRMAIEDNGELIILAPGVERFGEDDKIDSLIRKYGYKGRIKVLEMFDQFPELRENMSAAAHLIHGSSDDRFNITYAVKNLTKEEVEQVNFNYESYDDIVTKYDPKRLKYGWNNLDGEEVFFVPNPALGLWINKQKFSK